MHPNKETGWGMSESLLFLIILCWEASSLHVVRLPTNKWPCMFQSSISIWLHSIKGACQQAAKVLLAAVLFVRVTEWSSNG